MRVLCCVLLSALAFGLGCAPATGSADGGGLKPCATNTDCPSGEFCKSQLCTKLPCGGRCADDEACVDEVCKVADGLSCSSDPTVCPSTFTCAANGKCARACEDDTDCTQPGFKSCNPDTGTCGECTFDRDCQGSANGKFCDSNTATCVGCVDATSCYVNGVAVGKICDGSTRQCVDGCHDTTDCPIGKRCDGGSDSSVGRCVECEPATEGNDCISPPKVRCDPQSLACVECLGNGDCASAQCNTTKHQCVDCVENDVCEKGQVCDLDTNTCFPGCVGGAGGPNCPAAQPVCDNTLGERGTCVECLHDADCPRTEVCNTLASPPSCVPGCVSSDTGLPSDGRCLDTTGQTPPPTDVKCDGDLGSRGECVECLDSSQCPSDKTCDSTTHKCRCKGLGESCTANSDCGYDPDTQTCFAAGAACIKTCDSGTLPHPVCSQLGTGLVGQTGGSCGSSFVTAWATDVNGAHKKFCVPPNTCH